jgi:hypothetical protein
MNADHYTIPEAARLDFEAAKRLSMTISFAVTRELAHIPPQDRGDALLHVIVGMLFGNGWTTEQIHSRVDACMSALAEVQTGGGQA